MKPLLLLCLLLSPLSHADEWSHSDTIRESGYQVLAGLDWLQTLQLTKSYAGKSWVVVHDGGIETVYHKPPSYEQNVILGRTPSRSRINAYFLSTGILHYYVAKALPTKYRAPFQYVTIGIEISAVAHNYAMGIRIPF